MEASNRFLFGKEPPSRNGDLMLDELAKKHGTDKSSLRHDYCVAYEEHLEKFRLLPVKLLEIGILDGNSLRLWKEYFPNGEIYGIDINPKCKQYEEERVRVAIGDQTDEQFLASITDSNEFDIIIDDGSHIWDHLVISFECLFPHLKSGGLYVMEDLLDCYDPGHSGMAGISAINYLKNTIDNVNFHGMVFRPDRVKPVRAAAFKDYVVNERPRTDPRNRIKSLHFYCGMCVIRKS